MIRVVCTLAACVAVIFVVSLSTGDQPIPPTLVFTTLFSPGEADFAVHLIVAEIRLPRALMALLVGAALAVAGLIAQAVMRNPLAEPGLLGINSGAALAALVVLVHLKWTAPEIVSGAAFAGALLLTAIVYVLSWKNGLSSMRIILIGIGLNALAGAATSFVSAFGDITSVQNAQVWLAGSLYNAGWPEVRLLFAWLIPVFTVTALCVRQLDLMLFDDTTARGLGARTQAVKGVLVLLCALISGAAVAAAGLIVFVGLIAPHISRRLVGYRHGRTLPVTILVGALLVSCADLLGRTVIAPAQLPAGLMTILIGAPFFGFLLWERRNVRG